MLWSLGHGLDLTREDGRKETINETYIQQGYQRNSTNVTLHRDAH